MTDREFLLLRRRALMVAAATAGLSCGPPAVSQVCLSVAVPRCPEEHLVSFAGSSTTVGPEDEATLEKMAEAIRSSERRVALVVRVIADGHEAAASVLHQPRLEAVREALVARGVSSDAFELAPIDDVGVDALNWAHFTGDGNPLTLSGFVQLMCA